MQRFVPGAALAALVFALGASASGAEEAAGVQVAAGAAQPVVCLGRRLTASAVDATRQTLACQGDAPRSAKRKPDAGAIVLESGQTVAASCAGPRLVVGNRARRDAMLFCEALPHVSAAPSLADPIPELTDAAARGSTATRTER
jgi:hypothetical protein